MFTYELTTNYFTVLEFLIEEILNNSFFYLRYDIDVKYRRLHGWYQREKDSTVGVDLLWFRNCSNSCFLQPLDTILRAQNCIFVRVSIFI